MAAFSYLAFAAFPIGMVLAGVSDLFTMTIPNRISVLLAIAFVVLVPVAGMDFQEIMMHCAAGGIVLAIGFALFAFGWIGGGDAKLAAIAALWLGSQHALEFVGISAVFGGALTLLILSFRRAPIPAMIMRQPWVARLHEEGHGVPYGIALAAGAMLIYPQTPWMQLIAG